MEAHNHTEPKDMCRLRYLVFFSLLTGEYDKLFIAYFSAPSIGLVSETRVSHAAHKIKNCSWLLKSKL